MRHQPYAFVVATAVALGLAASAPRAVIAQSPAPRAAVPPSAAPHVSEAIFSGESLPLRDIPRRYPSGPKRLMEPRRVPGGPTQQVADGATQTTAMNVATVANGIGFEGIGQGSPNTPNFFVQYAPSDINGAVGTTQYVQWVNTSFAVFDKKGTILAGPTLGSALWHSKGGNCDLHNSGDPIAQWDKAAKRWVMTQFQISVTPYSQCVAVSTSEDATGTWSLYEFTYSEFPDYPKLGVWPDAYYISFNMFGATGSNFTGPRACAYERDKMLAGQPARQVCFQPTGFGGSFLPSDLDGTTPPPSGAPNPFLNFGSNSLRRWKFHVDWANTANSTFTGPTSIAVSPFTPSCFGSCVPQIGTTQLLDSLGDRLMYRLAYRNFGDHEALVVNHSVTANGVTAPRWYEIRDPNGAPVVFQQSTYSTDTLYRWMGSAAMDRFGNFAIGYSVSSGAMNPAIRFAGRAATDPINTLGVETALKSGTGSQISGLSRWGDYTALSVDPVDDCTFWYTNQFLKTNGTWNWSTWIATFSFPDCGGTPPPPTADFTIAATPSSQTITAGGSTSYGVTVTPTNGYKEAGTYSVIGHPTGATPTFNPPDYTGGGGTSTLGITTTSSTAAGSYPLTIRASDGTLSHTTTATLVVNAPVTSSFTMSVSPSNRTVRGGNSGSYSITLTRTGGFTGAVALSVAGLPFGATSNFPLSTAGSSANLTVKTSTTPKGTFTLTITASGGGIVRTSNVSLKVN